jgi:hypothetical protein
LPARRPRRPAGLLPLPDPRGAQGGAHHQRDRAALPRGPQTHPPHGHFQDKTSMDRILFAVFIHENRNQGLATPFPLTQTF